MEGNASRLVAKLRWVIESVNGRIKNVFNFFDNTISNHYVGNGKLRRFIRIASALLNAYFPVIRSDKVGDVELAQYMLDRAEMSNLLQIKIRNEGWDKRRVCWKPLTHGAIDDFPGFTVDELRSITVGVYQLKLAPAYAARHIALGNDHKMTDFHYLIGSSHHTPCCIL